MAPLFNENQIDFMGQVRPGINILILINDDDIAMVAIYTHYGLKLL